MAAGLVRRLHLSTFYFYYTRQGYKQIQRRIWKCINEFSDEQIINEETHYGLMIGGGTQKCKQI